MTIADPLSSSVESAKPVTAKAMNIKPQSTSASRKDRNIGSHPQSTGATYGTGPRR
jgi:hypothetical protein